MSLAKELTGSQKDVIIAATIAKVIGCHRTTVLRFLQAMNQKNLHKNNQVGRAFSISGIDKN